jgi:hypothetical protein
MRTAIIISMALIALSSNPLFTQRGNSKASAAPIAAPVATTALHMPASARTQNGSQQTKEVGVSGRPSPSNLPVDDSAAH